MLKKTLKNEEAFTLVEMLIVLLVISVLMILIVPTLSSSSEDINDKGCSALVQVVQTQIELYYLEERHHPASLDELVQKSYITENQTSCSSQQSLSYDSNTGIVKKSSE